MGKQRRNWLAVLLAAAFCGGGWLMLRPPEREPVYEGKPLSYWLESYGPIMVATNRSQREADAAVRQAGTNALPTLLRMLRARNSSMTLKLVELVQQQHFVAIHFLFPRLDRNYQAQVGFRILRADASNAVPALIKILEEKRSWESAMFTAISLGNIGPAAAAAVPALLQNATDPESEARGSSLLALGLIGAVPERVVPVLIHGLNA